MLILIENRKRISNQLAVYSLDFDITCDSEYVESTPNVHRKEISTRYMLRPVKHL